MSDSSEELFDFRCTSCSIKVRAKVRAAGRSLKCPNCGNQITIPQPARKTANPVVPKPELDKAEEAPALQAGPTARPSLFDVDELVLKSDPLADAEQRKQHSEAVSNEKLAQRRRRIESDKQRWEEKPVVQDQIEPHSKRQSAEAQFNDGYTLLNEEKTATPLAQASPSIFDDDLPDLIKEDFPSGQFNAPKSDQPSVVRNLPPSNTSPPPLKPDDLLPLRPTDSTEEIEDQYRVICPTCGTAQYVTRNQQGTPVKCPDCTSKFRVLPPPANWTPSKISKRHREFNEESPMVIDQDIQQIDQKQQSRTRDMLARAESELDKEAKEQRDYGVDFDTQGFVQRTFSFLRDPVAIGMIVGYSIVFSVVFALVQYGLNTDGSFLRQGAALFCMLAGPLLGVLFGLPMISAALAQLEATANKQEKVVDWPSLNIFEHFGDLMAVVFALGAAAIPGYVLGIWLGGELVTAGRIQLTLVMLGLLFLFPLFLLSVLDNGSPLQLLSGDVMRSIKFATEAWGGYYLKTLVVFTFTLVLWYLLLGKGKSPALAAVAGAMVPPLVFFTFQQLGVLADDIGENLSFTVGRKPEKSNETDGENAVDDAAAN